MPSRHKQTDRRYKPPGQNVVWTAAACAQDLALFCLSAPTEEEIADARRAEDEAKTPSVVAKIKNDLAGAQGFLLSDFSMGFYGLMCLASAVFCLAFLAHSNGTTAALLAISVGVSMAGAAFVGAVFLVRSAEEQMTACMGNFHDRNTAYSSLPLAIALRAVWEELPAHVEFDRRKAALALAITRGVTSHLDGFLYAPKTEATQRRALMGSHDPLPETSFIEFDSITDLVAGFQNCYWTCLWEQRSIDSLGVLLEILAENLTTHVGSMSGNGEHLGHAF